ncbi:hypothetical protein MTO96_007456 [Rhipicephalus appendiculatus]
MALIKTRKGREVMAGRPFRWVTTASPPTGARVRWRRKAHQRCLKKLMATGRRKSQGSPEGGKQHDEKLPEGRARQN